MDLCPQSSGFSKEETSRKRQIEEDEDVDISIVGVESLIGEWVAEVQAQIDWSQGEWEAWDDVKGGSLPTEGVSAARQEEVSYMMGRALCSQTSSQEC